VPVVSAAGVSVVAPLLSVAPASAAGADGSPPKPIAPPVGVDSAAVSVALPAGISAGAVGAAAGVASEEPGSTGALTKLLIWSWTAFCSWAVVCCESSAAGGVLAAPYSPAGFVGFVDVSSGILASLSWLV